MDPRTVLPSLRRRHFLGATAALTLFGLGGLQGCASLPALNGSFLQVWRSHLDWSRAEWRQRMAAMRTLGCREVVLQWAGIYGGSDSDWFVPDAVIETIFDTAAARGMHVRMGLPFDNRWWQVLQSPDGQNVTDFFERALAAATDYMQRSPWPQQRYFGGWYIPYEIEQYSWADPGRQMMLAQWLRALATTAQSTGDATPAISTYFSRLPSTGTLTGLWQSILAQAALLPMVQDGVGVAGWSNLDHLAPLIAAFRAAHVEFDMVVELFEELPASGSEQAGFRAQSADWARVQRQLEWASQTGARRILGFAVEPWLTNEDARARALRRAWLDARF